MKPKTATETLALTDEQFVVAETEEIRRLLRRTAQDIVTIGQKLTAIKGKLKHGEWGAYLRREFNWEERTAQRFMNVGERFKSDNLSDLNIAPSALYLLAAPSAPEEAAEDILARARAGERITGRDAEDALKKARELMDVAALHAEEEWKTYQAFLWMERNWPTALAALQNERMVELRLIDRTTPRDRGFVFVSEALRELHGSRWYTEASAYFAEHPDSTCSTLKRSAYATWEEYCLGRFGMGGDEVEYYLNWDNLPQKELFHDLVAA